MIVGSSLIASLPKKLFDELLLTSWTLSGAGYVGLSSVLKGRVNFSVKTGKATTYKKNLKANADLITTDEKERVKN